MPWNYVRNQDLRIEHVREEFRKLEKYGYKEIFLKEYVFSIEDNEGGKHGFKSLVYARRYINREWLTKSHTTR